MNCIVSGCRFKNTHYTIAHKCGSCHKYGHGRQECFSNKRVVDYNKETSENKCTNSNCKIPETHDINAHQKDFELPLKKIRLYNDMGHLMYDIKNTPDDFYKILNRNMNIETVVEVDHRGYGFQFYHYYNKREFHVLNGYLYDINYEGLDHQIAINEYLNK
jgi:hypothetical protein